MASGEREPGGDLRQSLAQPLRFSVGELAIERKCLGPDDQIVGEHDDLDPHLVERERLEGQPLKANPRRAGVGRPTSLHLSHSTADEDVALYNSSFSVRDTETASISAPRKRPVGREHDPGAPMRSTRPSRGAAPRTCRRVARLAARPASIDAAGGVRTHDLRIKSCPCAGEVSQIRAVQCVCF